MAEHFEGLVVPRVERAKRHELLDIIVITICAVICGADNRVEVEEFGHAKLEWLSRFLRVLQMSNNGYTANVGWL